MKNDWNLCQVVDSEWRRKASCVAENDTEGALLLEYLHAKKVCTTFIVAYVNMERTNVLDGKTSRPMAVFHI